MSKILQLIQDHEVRRFEPGQIVMEQGAQTNRLYVLIDGKVEVVKDDVRVSTIAEAGATFGEIAVLLKSNHTAMVRALTPCSFHVIENPQELLQTSPAICFHVCVLLARRLDSLTRYLVDVKQQFEGHDHIGMVDEVLEALLHRQPRERVRPRESTIGSGEPPEGSSVG
jgi:CRP/FNR family transcriptional regulator, cyclic AMP receptor protein